MITMICGLLVFTCVAFLCVQARDLRCWVAERDGVSAGPARSGGHGQARRGPNAALGRLHAGGNTCSNSII